VSSSSEFSLRIGRHRKRLSEIIQPDFGLLHQLLSSGVVTDRDYHHIRAGESVYDRSDRLLHCLASSSSSLSSAQYHALLAALERTDQIHVANYIRADAGRSSFFNTYTDCPRTTKHNCSCQNFVKFPPTLIIFGTEMAWTIKLCEGHPLSTSPSFCQCTTVLTADAPNCYLTQVR